MRFQVVDCCRDGLSRRTLVERGFGLLAACPSVAVHVVGAEMVVVDADGLPVAVLEDEQDDRVALNRPPGLAEPDEHPVNDLDIYCPLIRHGWAASHVKRTATTNRLRSMPKDAKQNARAVVKRAQSKFERTGSRHEEAREARRESFELARNAGLTLREIGEAADLHLTRVKEILDKD